MKKYILMFLLAIPFACKTHKQIEKASETQVISVKTIDSSKQRVFSLDSMFNFSKSDNLNIQFHQVEETIPLTTGAKLSPRNITLYAQEWKFDTSAIKQGIVKRYDANDTSRSVTTYVNPQTKRMYAEIKDGSKVVKIPIQSDKTKKLPKIKRKETDWSISKSSKASTQGAKSVKAAVGQTKQIKDSSSFVSSDNYNKNVKRNSVPMMAGIVAVIAFVLFILFLFIKNRK